MKLHGRNLNVLGRLWEKGTRSRTGIRQCVFWYCAQFAFFSKRPKFFGFCRGQWWVVHCFYVCYLARQKANANKIEVLYIVFLPWHIATKIQKKKGWARVGSLSPSRESQRKVYPSVWHSVCRFAFHAQISSGQTSTRQVWEGIILRRTWSRQQSGARQVKEEGYHVELFFHSSPRASFAYISF